MATLEQLEVGVRKAYEAGNMQYARVLGAELVRARASLANQIPGAQVPGTETEAPAPTIGESVVGAAETGATLATGATSGTLGMLGGTLKGLAEEILSGKFGTPEARGIVEKAATEGMQALTYAPRTKAGQEMTADAAKVLQQAVPVTGLTGELALVGRAASAAAPAAAAAASKAAQPVVAVAKTVAEKLTPSKTPTPGTKGSVGAGGTDMATLRQAKADELPVPIKLTEGQKTRDFAQQRFERETAKIPEAGEPLRERFAQQNLQLQQNIDAFIDMTGAEAPDLRSVGISVDKALRERAARDKARVRVLYKDAEKAGEMEAPVALETLVQHLNDSAPEAEVANVLKAVRAKAIQLGAAAEGADGALVAQPVSLRNAELLRRSVNAATNAEPTNIRQAAIMKGLIDESTDGLGGNLYKQARAARSQYASDYENIGLVKQLLGTKRGSDDRAIALEDVLRRSIVDPSTSLDTVKQVRRLLQTGGENGKQAWKELQGGTLRYIKDEALRNVAPDQAGNRIMSPAQLERVISQLDKTGKLDYVFGKRGAEMLRTVNDVAKDVLTSPPGAVNTSNTATVLAGLMDVAISGASGIPAPIMTSMRVLTSSIHDAKLRQRVRAALGEK